jgi:hypothetical protein
MSLTSEITTARSNLQQQLLQSPEFKLVDKKQPSQNQQLRALYKVYRSHIQGSRPLSYKQWLAASSTHTFRDRRRKRYGK